jgi:hypothetical protein
MKSQELLAGYGNRIVLRPVRSRLIITFITVLHFLALSLLLFIDLSPWLLILLAGLILVNFYKAFIFSNSCAQCLSLQLGKGLLLGINENSWHEIDVVESLLTNWLVILRVRRLNDSSMHSLVYAVDSLNRHSFRQLRIYLNHYKLPAKLITK